MSNINQMPTSSMAGGLPPHGTMPSNAAANPLPAFASPPPIHVPKTMAVSAVRAELEASGADPNLFLHAAMFTVDQKDDKTRGCRAEPGRGMDVSDAMYTAETLCRAAGRAHRAR